MTTQHVSASERIEFDPLTGPIVKGQRGILNGCRFRLSALTLTVYATTQDDGSVRIHTHLMPEVAALVSTVGDPITHADWRHLVIGTHQLPAEAQAAHRVLVSTVHILHPSLRYADAPLDNIAPIALSLTAVSA